jgi:hypothetical protein
MCLRRRTADGGGEGDGGDGDSRLPSWRRWGRRRRS